MNRPRPIGGSAAEPGTSIASELPAARRWQAGPVRAAWRTQRGLVTAGAALGLVFTGLLALFRARLHAFTIDIASSAAAGCRRPGPVSCSDVNDYVNGMVNTHFAFANGLLQYGCIALAVGVGALAGAPAFAREFEHRTQVFALTQSVSRTSWWAVKTAVSVIPTSLIMLTVGAASSWAYRESPWSQSTMDAATFLSRSYIPAVVALLTSAIGVLIGILGRSTIGALVLTVVLAVVVVAGADSIRPHLTAVDRQVQPIKTEPTFDDTGWFQGIGFLDPDGHPAQWDQDCTSEWSIVDPSTHLTTDQTDRLTQQCASRAGISDEYLDTIPTTQFASLRARWSAIIALLAALALFAGGACIRRRNL